MNNANHSNLIFGAVWGIVFAIMLNTINVCLDWHLVEMFLEDRTFTNFFQLCSVYVFPLASSLIAAIMDKNYFGIIVAPFIAHGGYWIILLIICVVELFMKYELAAAIGILLLVALIVSAFSGGEDFWVFIFKD